MVDRLENIETKVKEDKNSLTEKKKFVGIEISGLLLIFFGAYGFINELRHILNSFSAWTFPEVIFSILWMVVNILVMVSGFNILKQKNWARRLVLGVMLLYSSYLLVLSLAFFSMLFKGDSKALNSAFGFVALIGYVSILIYLTRPKVKQQFIKGEGTNPECSEKIKQ